MTYKIKQSKKLPPEERRMQLLMSAEKLFSKKGYRMTTTEEIAKNAGLTKGALYFHFKSKEDVLFALIKHIIEHYKKGLEEQKAVLKSPADYILFFFNSKEKCPSHDQLAGDFNFWSQIFAIPKIKSYLKKAFAEFTEITADNLDRKYGKTKKERRELMYFTFAILDGLKLREMVLPENLDVQQNYRIYKSLLDGKVRAK